MDERYAVIDVAGKGLVILSAYVILPTSRIGASNSPNIVVALMPVLSMSFVTQCLNSNAPYIWYEYYHSPFFKTFIEHELVIRLSGVSIWQPQI